MWALEVFMNKDNVATPVKKNTKNKIIYYIVLMVFVAVGATAYVYGKQFIKNIPNAMQEVAIAQLKPIKLSEALSKAQNVAKEKSDNSKLILAADDEGDSILYYTLGLSSKKKIATENLDGVSKQWLFGYLKDKTKTYKPDTGNSFSIPKADIFMVKVNSSEAVVHAEQAYGDVPLSTLSDLTPALQDQNLDEAILKIQNHFTADIKKYDYAPDNFKGLDFLILNKQYIVFLGKFVPEPVYTIRLRYEKDGLKREFSADYMFNTKEINSKRISPEDK